MQREKQLLLDPAQRDILHAVYYGLTIEILYFHWQRLIIVKDVHNNLIS